MSFARRFAPGSLDHAICTGAHAATNIRSTGIESPTRTPSALTDHALEFNHSQGRAKRVTLRSQRMTT
jgi:hypothetical protein